MDWNLKRYFWIWRNNNYMRKKRSLKLLDFLFEFSIGIGALITASIFAIVIGVIFILPISNYHHADGIVEYKNQYNIISEYEGIIQKVIISNGEYVNCGEPLIKFISKDNKDEIKQIDIEINYLKKNLNLLKKLYSLGSLKENQLKLKELELEQKIRKRRTLSECLIHAPEAGFVNYNFLPQEINGAFIHKGQNIGTIYKDSIKDIRISFPNHFADRFLIGAKVLIKYKDPKSLKVSRLTGEIYNKFNDTKSQNIYLYCNIDKGDEKLKLLQNSTMVKASILINETSIAEDIFKIKIPINLYDKIISKI